MKNLAIAYAVHRKGKKMAKGGDLDHGQRRGPEGYPKYQEQAQNEKGIHTPVSGVTGFPGGKGTSRAGDFTKDRYGGKPTFEAGPDHPARREHHRILKESRAMPAPNIKGLAHGGEVHEEDMVDRIMKHRDSCYSEGGMVANDDEPIADEMPAEYDDLALRDGLEEHYTGKNSGDELGDHQEDEDRHDMVSKIMKSRSKKDRMPRPA